MCKTTAYMYYYFLYFYKVVVVVTKVTEVTPNVFRNNSRLRTRLQCNLVTVVTVVTLHLPCHKSQILFILAQIQTLTHFRATKRDLSVTPRLTKL